MPRNKTILFFNSRLFADMVVIGGLLTAIMTILLYSSHNFRLYAVAFFLILASAWTGNFVNDFSLKTTIHPGIELYMYAGIMITYLSNPWIGILAILLSFYLTNRIRTLFWSLVKGRRPDKWVFAEGVQDMLHYFLLELNMWLYVALLLIMPKLGHLWQPLVLWNVISFASTVGDSLINRHVPIERPDAIGRAPWIRFVIYFFLFAALSPLLVSFVLNGTLDA